LLLSSSLGVALTVLMIPVIDTFSAMIITFAVLGTAEAAIWSVLGAYASVEAKANYGHGTMMGGVQLCDECGGLYRCHSGWF